MSKDSRTPQELRTTVVLHLVMKAYVKEVPVVQSCRVQDGAEVTVELITTDQIIFCCPASATIKGAKVLPLT